MRKDSKGYFIKNSNNLKENLLFDSNQNIRAILTNHINFRIYSKERRSIK